MKDILNNIDNYLNDTIKEKNNNSNYKDTLDVLFNNSDKLNINNHYNKYMKNKEYIGYTDVNRISTDIFKNKDFYIYETNKINTEKTYQYYNVPSINNDNTNEFYISVDIEADHSRINYNSLIYVPIIISDNTGIYILVVSSTFVYLFTVIEYDNNYILYPMGIHFYLNNDGIHYLNEHLNNFNIVKREKYIHVYINNSPILTIEKILKIENISEFKDKYKKYVINNINDIYYKDYELNKYIFQDILNIPYGIHNISWLPNKKLILSNEINIYTDYNDINAFLKKLQTYTKDQFLPQLLKQDLNIYNKYTKLLKTSKNNNLLLLQQILPNNYLNNIYTNNLVYKFTVVSSNNLRDKFEIYKNKVKYPEYVTDPKGIKINVKNDKEDLKIYQDYNGKNTLYINTLTKYTFYKYTNRYVYNLHKELLHDNPGLLIEMYKRPRHWYQQTTYHSLPIALDITFKLNKEDYNKNMVLISFNDITMYALYDKHTDSSYTSIDTKYALNITDKLPKDFFNFDSKQHNYKFIGVQYNNMDVILFFKDNEYITYIPVGSVKASKIYICNMGIMHIQDILMFNSTKEFNKYYILNSLNNTNATNCDIIYNNENIQDRIDINFTEKHINNVSKELNNYI